LELLQQASWSIYHIDFVSLCTDILTCLCLLNKHIS
jgi:hypothetical protein